MSGTWQKAFLRVLIWPVYSGAVGAVLAVLYGAGTADPMYADAMFGAGLGALSGSVSQPVR